MNRVILEAGIQIMGKYKYNFKSRHCSNTQKGLFQLGFFIFIVFFLSQAALGEKKAAGGLDDSILRPLVVSEVAELNNPFFNSIEDAIKKETINKPPATTEGNVVKSLPAYTIQGVIWGTELPLAIINNKVLKIGDMLDEAKVENIDKNGVVVSLKGNLFTLSAPAFSHKQAK